MRKATQGFRCVLLLSATLLFLFFGCYRAESRSSSDNGFIVRPTSLTINSGIGRGVLLSYHDKVVLLTARHVATLYGCSLDTMTLDYECRGGKIVQGQIVDGAKRWLTTANPSVDLAWIVLNQSEMPPIEDCVFASVESLTKDALQNALGSCVMVASYQDKSALFTNFVDVVDAKAEGNRNLKSISQRVGCLQANIQPSESGSPVFAKAKDGKSFDLIGIVTETDRKSEAGFVPVYDIAGKIHDNLEGCLLTELYRFEEELW